ncbi:MAG: c-type cytochrome biogenesis protein CcsB [Actinobacteria bacterium HGW-Actinobacteria-4]|nr:MAG: c-type cytochrome biogenesis protein CcsB [Actinobacteria bacterium HGW-Actinobacteria-4]
MNAQTLSVMALWAATTLYSIAMLAYAVRFSRMAEVQGATKRQSLVTAGAPTSPESGTVASQPQPPAPDRALGIARATMLVGALFHMLGVGARAVEAGHVPWSTMYEYTITGSLVTVLVFLGVQARRDIAYLGAGVSGLAAVSLGLALSVLYAASTGLPPALQSFWLIIHVSIAIIATGVFAVAFIATIAQLIRDRYESVSPRPEGRLARGAHSLPPAAALEALAFRLNAVGFVLWTFTVMAGAVWAEHVWGRYWGWDPKEVWSFVIWVIFAAYLHARTTQGWGGRRSAYLALVGFVALIMNFTVVNYVFQGLHTYAGP